MSAYETMFVFQFLLYVSIFLVKIYNVMSIPSTRKEKRSKFNEGPNVMKEENKIFPYDIRMSFILFIVTCLSFGLGIIIFLQNPLSNNLLFSSLIQLQSWTFLINVFLLVFELLFNWGITISDSTIKAKMSILPGDRR